MEVIEKVKEIIAEVSGINFEDITPDIKINDNMNITSIVLIQIVAELEMRLEIELLDDDLDISKYETIGDFFKAVERTSQYEE